ncbi:MAG: glutaredoxin family protein [Geminicoccaceae bacterium]
MAKIEIFTGPSCTYCETAKTMLRNHGLEFEDYDVSSEAAHLDEFRRRLPRTKAVPQIFVDGAHIGDIEDLRQYLATGMTSP